MAVGLRDAERGEEGEGEGEGPGAGGPARGVVPRRGEKKARRTDRKAWRS